MNDMQNLLKYHYDGEVDRILIKDNLLLKFTFT